MADKKVIRTIGVLTSGGDAPGMNAAIRAVVRTALGKGLKVRGIRRGYQGLLNEEIIDLSARDVSDTIERGGTILQTARCAEMRTEEGQQKAAAICKKYGCEIICFIVHRCSQYNVYEWDSAVPYWALENTCPGNEKVSPNTRRNCRIKTKWTI